MLFGTGTKAKFDIIMSKLNYQEKIPNNVNLSNDMSLQRALEHWQPKFKSWWKEMGPEDFQENEVSSDCNFSRCGRMGIIWKS